MIDNYQLDLKKFLKEKKEHLRYIKNKKSQKHKYSGHKKI
jgi:hypothetical protein